MSDDCGKDQDLKGNQLRIRKIRTLGSEKCHPDSRRAWSKNTRSGRPPTAKGIDLLKTVVLATAIHFAHFMQIPASCREIFPAL
jgi:hypothetical protein